MAAGDPQLPCAAVVKLRQQGGINCRQDLGEVPPPGSILGQLADLHLQSAVLNFGAEEEAGQEIASAVSQFLQGAVEGFLGKEVLLQILLADRTDE